MLTNVQKLQIILLTAFLILFVTTCGGQKGEKTSPQLNLSLPSFLGFVAPAPNSEFSVASYNKGEHYPPISEAHPAPQEGRQRVCIELLSKPLLEPGDYFAASSQEGEFLPDRVVVYVDGNKVVRDTEVIMLLFDTEMKDENGFVIAQAPSSYLICWPIKLEKGVHIVTVEVTKTSGAIVNYSWSFTLK